ncbi:MAG: M23 family metallopeptidase [Reyranellaceae bacterium]
MKTVPLIAAAVLALLAGSAPHGTADRPAEQARAEDRLLGARDEELAVTREIAADATVAGLLELAFVRAGLGASMVAELRRAFAGAVDLQRDVRPGDAIHVRYAETRMRGVVIARRLLWAEFRTRAKGSVSVHRFRSRDNVERLWLADGQAARPPEMRMPLDAVVVSSGFGVRPDPFDRDAVKPASTASHKRGASAKPLDINTPLSVLLGLPCLSCLHEGIDLVAAAGTPIHAAADGVVSGVGPNGRYGNWIRIDHDGKLATVYGHLKEFAPGIEVGRKVARGEVIGLVGSTGHSTGAHLHFELRSDGRPVDPQRSPAFKVERLAGPELERLRRQVARSLEQRDQEAARR